MKSQRYLSLLICFAFSSVFCGLVKKSQKYIGCANFPKLMDEEEVPKSVTERVMDGVPTMKPLPYQLRLKIAPHPGQPWEALCGAVIVSPRHALTAYHCIGNKDGRIIPNKYFTVYAGAYNFKNLTSDKNVQKRGVLRPFPLKFKNGSRYNIVPDLAVLLLDEPLQMNEFVTPACLPTKEVPMNEECIVSGWGKTVSYSLSSSATLRAATVLTSKLQHCSHMDKMDDGTRIPVGDYDLCTYHPTKSACQGDSGGPLVCKINGGATLYGVVSRGKPCNPHDPKVKYGLYGNVYYFKDEIEALIGTDNPCPTNENYYADEFCDGNLNNSENCFDGGDCCGAEANYEYCNSYDQECKCRS